MEGDPIGLHPPLPIRSNLSPRETPKRNVSTRDQRWQKALGQDGRTRPSPTYARATDKIRPTLRTSPITVSRPLLPASEPRSAEEAGTKVNKSPTGERWSPSVEGGTVGREGRHFTVANVGNNGQIYLRPTARPGNQRYPQPPVAFPNTPPNADSRDAFSPKKSEREEVSKLSNGLWTPTLMTDSSSPNRISRSPYFDTKPPNSRRRAVSDSTSRDVTPGLDENDAGVFKIMISKPQTEAKSKTAEDLDSQGGTFLQVSIPSWKLGTPRFTLRGTPLIRESSYAPTEDMRSNHASFLISPGEKTNRLLPPESFRSRIASFRSSQSQYPSSPWPLPNGGNPSSPKAQLAHAAFMPATLVIEPAMFDALTFKPTCDDRSIVRYSSNTRAVIAATPPRLVAEITSPSFLDYDLISDFFLTFRSFLNASDLLRLLIARLRWALSQDDESGMIVKVRTFVAIRHWILNYFVDDFVVDYRLRVAFCDLLNDFTDGLPTVQSKQKVPFKIVGELKKCWRRVCAQYWDGPEFDAELGHEVPIIPGGIAGHRDPSLTPSFWETRPVEAPQAAVVPMQSAGSLHDTSSPTSVTKIGQIDTRLQSHARPSTPGEGTVTLNQQPTSPVSPMSIASLDVVSCSFPTKALRIGDPDASTPLGAHPVDPSSIYTNVDPVASTPRALMGRHVRPRTSHRRNNSLTDSLREHGTITENVLFKNAEFLLTLPYAGSLVRGNLMPPGQPFVELDHAAGKWGSRHTTVFQPQPTIVPKGKASASAMSSQGMRRLLGSVRRALSTRDPGISQGQNGFIDIAPIGPRGATTNRLPGTAVVPQIRESPVQPFRIDMLGARIAEDFKQAVREDAAERKSATVGSRSLTENVAEHVEYSAAHLDSSFELRPLSDAAITTGSQSIVIVDGTAPPEQLVMTGALPPFNPSVETFSDSMVQIHGRDPTPPMTPPSGNLSGNTPRRSSYILSQHVYDASLSTDPLPPLRVPRNRVNGVDGMDEHASGANKATKSPPITSSSSKKPPSSYYSRHRRQKSSRSYRSRGSLSQRRWASFHSGLAAHSTVRSFDATTCSEGSIKSEVMPPPLRMLRRKPGGDLRGAANTTQRSHVSLRRSRSIGSLTAYSDSLRSSYIRSPIRDSSGFVDIVSSDYSQNRGEVFSLGAMAEQAPKKPPSLFSTHSSKPVMRPSFEVEAQKLAQIPDDADDDGGVESALLKLEGKYERRARKLSIEPRKISSKDLENLRAESLSSVGDGEVEEEKKKHRHLHVGDDEVPVVSPIDEDSVTDNLTQIHGTYRSGISSFLSEDSMETYNSIPLLERGLTDEGRSRTHTREWTNHSILEGPDTPVDELGAPVATSSLNPSFEFINRTESFERDVAHISAVNPSEDRSFLNVGSDNDSELSSELSAEIIDEHDYVPRPLSSNQVQEQYITPYPSRTSEISYHLDEDNASSVKLTLAQALQMSPEADDISEVHEHQLWSKKPLPPTPETTPKTAMYHKTLGSPSDPLKSRQTLSNTSKSLEHPAPAIPAAVHLPFILAFDSEVLAQQFTLIEKDALNEVDWKELIEMKWKDSHNDSRSWVDFLRNSDARGVEVVIARFNIMVKWAISEIVLTQDLEERARCIIKLLHIAAHCRKYRNFATMSQITIALTSNEVGRLSRTWAMVPSTDMQTMSDLETLVSPTRNFNSLRVEMEGGGSTPDTGCIPFVGIYTHDLLFNAQRPSEIASSPTTPPLVNFERCRISASIVKTLLRLLEASTYYQFQPIEGITERCLWMGALKDDEIRRRSEILE